MINKPHKSTLYGTYQGKLSKLQQAGIGLSLAGLDLHRAEASERLALGGFVVTAVEYILEWYV